MAETLGEREQDRDRPQLARRPRAVGDRGGAGRASMPARPASPCIRAPTQRHITTARRARDCRGTGAAARIASSSTSRAIRGRSLVELVLAVKPDQCTLVPVMPGEITSQAGWPPIRRLTRSPASSARMKTAGVRVSLFVDPEPAADPWARRSAPIGSSSTPSRSRSAFERGPAAAAASYEQYVTAASLAHDRGPGRQRRSRSRSTEPDAVPRAAAPGRGVDRARADQPRAVRRPAAVGGGLLSPGRRASRERTASPIGALALRIGRRGRAGGAP